MKQKFLDQYLHLTQYTLLLELKNGCQDTDGLVVIAGVSVT